MAGAALNVADKTTAIEVVYATTVTCGIRRGCLKWDVPIVGLFCIQPGSEAFPLFSNVALPCDEKWPGVRILDTKR